MQITDNLERQGDKTGTKNRSKSNYMDFIQTCEIPWKRYKPNLTEKEQIKITTLANINVE